MVWVDEWHRDECWLLLCCCGIVITNSRVLAWCQLLVEVLNVCWRWGG
jgi:hypothetical protein